MILSGFGVELRRIARADIEQIREWRNSDVVRQQMFHEELISEIQQEAWFERVNNPLNYFFMIHVGVAPIGLIYAKEVDPSTMLGEGGIFVGNPRFLSTDVPARASLLMLYFCFNILGLNSSLIKIKKGNDVAISYNQLLGYKIQSVVGNEITLVLTKDAFEASRYIQRLAQVLPKESIQLLGTPSDNNLDLINRHLNLKG
jgi:RimJ/RimL family protein N-acetyltransferase